MKEITYIIPEAATELITGLVQQLGGSVEKEKVITTKAKKSGNKKTKSEVDHTYLFGKWKDFDIDAKKLREDLWRKH